MTEPVVVQEQTIDDEECSGLILSFKRLPSGMGRLTITGTSLPFGNRDFVFAADGRFDGTGTRFYDPIPEDGQDD